MNKSVLILIIITLLSIDNTCIGQSTKDSCNNEIGIGLQVIPLGDINFLNISYKKNINKNLLRSGFGYELFNSLSNYCFMANVGYERRFFRKKAHLLLGADACFLIQHNGLVFSSTEIPKYFFNYGIGPVVGFMYRISHRFSFQSELCFYYGIMKQNYHSNNLYNFKKIKYGYIGMSKFFSLNLYYHFK